MPQDFFHQALVYLIAAVVSVPVAKRLGFGSVLGYLLAGIVIGPFVLKLTGNASGDVMHYAEFGVVMMLFLIGLEMKPHRLWEMRRSIFGLGGLQLVLTAVLLGGILMLTGRNPGESLAIGLMLGLSSTAIVLQTLAEKGLIEQAAGQASFSVLLFQDMAVIPILALLPLLALHDGAWIASQSAEIREIAGREVAGWFQVILTLGVITFIVAGGRYLANFMFRIIARTGLREIFTAMALLIVIASSLLMDLVGLSPALGAFLAGVVMANNDYRHELEADIEPFKALLLGLFFISVGAGIDFGVLARSPALVLRFLVLLIILKFSVLFILGKIFGLKGGQTTLFSFALAQGGEFAFVLISFGMENRVVDAHTASLLYLVVALSMAITPVLLYLNDKVVEPLVLRKTNEPVETGIETKDHPVIIAGFGRFGVVIGRFLIANGIGATILDSNPDNIEILRKFGFKVYYGDASRPGLLRSAGIDKAKLLIVAVDEKQKSLQIVDQVKRDYPHVKIMARATDMEHTYELMLRKVDGLNRDMFESALHLGIKALGHLGFQRYQAFRLAQTFRKHDEMVLGEMVQHYRDDENKYLSEARRYAKELEELLRAERDDGSQTTDFSWDVESLREEVREIYAESERNRNK